MSVLLLNASFEPLRVITVRRAIGLVLAGKADLVEAGDTPLRSATATHPVPVVVRLRYMVTVPFTARVPLNRRTLAARDGGVCQVTGCTRPGSTIDHVIPRARGGRHEWSNVAAMCPRHNNAKGDRLLDELGRTLKAQPRAPRGPLVLVEASDTAWQPYLAHLT